MLTAAAPRRRPPSSCDAYHKSKVLAELAAREIAKETGLEVSTVNPSMIEGPLLQPRGCSSSDLIKQVLEGMPLIPPVGLPFCDVRDVAEAHIKALETPEAGGRYLVVSETLLFTEVAEMLRAKFGDRYPVPVRRAPWLLMKLLSFVSQQAADAMPMWDIKWTFDCSATTALLGRELRSAPDAIFAMAESIDKYGLAKKK